MTGHWSLRSGAAAFFLLLGACSAQQVQFTADDVALAARVANASSVPAVAASASAIDPSGYKCWASIGPAMSALGAAGSSVGLATAIEVARVAIISVRSGGVCGALAQPLLAQLALVPGAANAIAMAAASVQ